MTKNFCFLGFIVISVIFSMTLQAATLTVTDNLIITKIDNKAVEHGLLSTTSKFVLSPGEHALILHYNDVFEDLDFAENRVIKSKDFVLKFTVSEEKNLELTTISINDLAQAESFSQSPTLLLIDDHNKKINLQLISMEDYKISQKVDIAVNTYTAKQNIKNNHISALSTKIDDDKPILSSTSSPAKNQTLGNTLIQVNSLTMLKYWWKTASSEDKKRFKQYITTQQ